MKKYNFDDVKKATLKYFDNNELATDVWIKKYCLKDSDTNYYELTPDDIDFSIPKGYEYDDFKLELTIKWKEIK